MCLCHFVPLDKEKHMLDLMIAPFAACLLIATLLSYFGLHVIRREIIFVDLALAQIAALGSVAGMLLGFSLDTPQAFGLSLVFTFFGALLFSFTRTKKGGVPQEALIGITYAVSAAAAILMLDRVPEGGEHLKEMLVGNILLVGWHEIAKIAALFAAIAAFHFVFRKNFLMISYEEEEAEKSGMSVAAWDFLFYATFGIVVTSLVQITGVLMIFSFLIVPAVCASLLFSKFNHRLAFAWLMSALASLGGLYGSAKFDFPTGATIVCVLGALLVLMEVYHAVKRTS